MIGFICLFFPAILSVAMVDAITKRDFCIKQFIYRFCVNTLIINLFCFLIKIFVLGAGAEYIFDLHGNTPPNVAAPYIAMALGAAIVLGLIESLLYKRVGVDLEEDKDEETEEQKEV